MLTRWLIVSLLLVGSLWGLQLSVPPPAYSGCVVETTATYTEGASIRDDKCDTAGNKKVTETYYVVTPITDVTVTSTATLVSALSASRGTLSCTNTDATVPVRWGNSTVTATKGQRIPAGTSIEIKARGAVYMISEATSVSMSCTEESQ